jgi:hypothetical protein
MSENRAPERYFYHSFPRRLQTEGHGHGLAILELIHDFGLLMPPEIARWEYTHADNSPPHRQSMVQRRISFTELAPAELPGHAKNFGPFALEFDIDALKRLGAIPVFYVPQAGDGHDAGGLGGTLMNHLIDAMRLTDRIAQMAAILDNAPPDRVRQAVTIPVDAGPALFDLDIKDAPDPRGFALLSGSVTDRPTGDNACPARGHHPRPIRASPFGPGRRLRQI